MHTTMVPVQVKTMKIQAGIQVSRPRELTRQLQLWKRFGRLYLIVFVLVRNIDDKVPIILGRPMLATAHARIDVFSKKISLKFCEPRDLEELLLSNDDLGIFLNNNDLLLNLENHDKMFLSPPGSARLNNDSSEMFGNPNSNSSIIVDDFLEMDDVKCQYVTRNTGKGHKNEENMESYKDHGFVGDPFDYRVTLDFGSIAGGLDPVNLVIRLPIERGINIGTREANCIMSFIKKMKNLNEVRVKALRSDNETEFKNHKLEEFYGEKGISQNFSSPCPEQNGVAKRRNRTLIEAARTMCLVHIHNHRDHLGKFNEKVDDGFFLGYSPVDKAFRVFNIRRQEMEEIVNVTFNEDDEAISQSSTEGDAINFNENRSFLDDGFFEPMSENSVSFEEPLKLTGADDHPALNELDQSKSADNLDSTESQDNITNEPISGDQPSLILLPSTEDIQQSLVPQDKWSREKRIKLVNIIGKPLAGITTRSRVIDSKAVSAYECLYVNFLSRMEPKKLIEALEEEGWIIAMQEELNQFERNKV
ncbi:retrovirus-related pol polyprotein from transposon TNT 1-94 [Tanacetum coccineum]